MKFKIIAALLATALCSSAAAVVVDHSGTTQVLISPFYSVGGGNDTLVTLSRAIT